MADARLNHEAQDESENGIIVHRTRKISAGTINCVWRRSFERQPTSVGIQPCLEPRARQSDPTLNRIDRPELLTLFAQGRKDRPCLLEYDCLVTDFGASWHSSSSLRRNCSGTRRIQSLSLHKIQSASEVVFVLTEVDLSRTTKESFRCTERSFDIGVGCCYLRF